MYAHPGELRRATAGCPDTVCPMHNRSCSVESVGKKKTKGLQTVTKGCTHNMNEIHLVIISSE